MTPNGHIHFSKRDNYLLLPTPINNYTFTIFSYEDNFLVNQRYQDIIIFSGILYNQNQYYYVLFIAKKKAATSS